MEYIIFVCCILGVGWTSYKIGLKEGGEKMIAQARCIRESLQKGPFIFNLGHGVLPVTPVDNLIKLAEFLRAPLE